MVSVVSMFNMPRDQGLMKIKPRNKPQNCWTCLICTSESGLERFEFVNCFTTKRKMTVQSFCRSDAGKNLSAHVSLLERVYLQIACVNGREAGKKPQVPLVGSFMSTYRTAVFIQEGLFVVGGGENSLPGILVCDAVWFNSL